MKLRVLAVMVALALFTAAPGFAQPNFSAGVKGGVSFANLSFDPDPDDAECCDMRTGFIGGLFLVAPINESIAIQPEFLYSMQGAKLEFREDFDIPESTIKTDYFQIPVLLRADFGAGSARPFVLVGPQFGFNVSAKQSGIGVSIDEDEDIKDDVNNFDFALAIGAGVQFGAASIEGRYTHGLLNVNEDSEDEGLDVKHRVWSILVGFRF